MRKILNKLIIYLKENPTSKLSCICASIYSVLGFNHTKGARGNHIIKTNAYLRNVRIIVEGYGNVVDLSGGGIF